MVKLTRHKEQQQMHFISRKLVCERLKISRKTAYTMFKCHPHAVMQNTQVLRKLNESRMGGGKPVEFIPSNLLTMKEAEARILVDGKPIKHRRFLRWVKSAKQALPHYRLSSHCIRIPADLFDDWIADRFTSKKGRSA